MMDNSARDRRTRIDTASLLDQGEGSGGVDTGNEILWKPAQEQEAGSQQVSMGLERWYAIGYALRHAPSWIDDWRVMLSVSTVAIDSPWVGASSTIQEPGEPKETSAALSEGKKDFVRELRWRASVAARKAWLRNCRDSATTRLFALKLPPMERSGRLSDVSGRLGLVSPWRSVSGHEHDEALERAIADAIMWSVHGNVLPDLGGSALESALLIQGPPLPKLQGRVFYRCLCADRPVVYVVTTDPMWLERIGGAARRRTHRADDAAVGTERCDFLTWTTEPFPDRSLDAGGRSFVAERGGRMCVHVHAYANCAGSDGGKNFWTKRRAEIDAAFQSHLRLPAGDTKTDIRDSIPGVEFLPIPLRAATEKAQLSLATGWHGAVGAAAFVTPALADDSEPFAAVLKVLLQGDPATKRAAADALNETRQAGRQRRQDLLEKALRANATGASAALVLFGKSLAAGYE